MAQEPRQSKLFAAEDYQNVYRSFKEVDFKAYDYETLKASLVESIQRNYPEDFNDYIESSEFIAIIELLSYLGMSLSFRADLNGRNNLMDTADRREAVVRIASMVNYQASRNLAANGIMKMVSVETTEPVTDSLGRNIANRTIYWNDPNNQDSYDQFTTILNAAFTQSTPFGRPAKRGTVGGVTTDLYKMENVKGLQVARSVQVTVNGQQLPFDVCNVDFEDGGNFEERHPDPDEAFHMIYRNDGQGFASKDTGFFLYLRQGTLSNYDFSYAFPENNRSEEISATNVNETDVYVQTINDDGSVVKKWTKVDYANGNENVVYNSIDQDVRSVYSVKTGVNDTVTIRYPDSDFGEVPTGTVRVWARRSSDEKVIVRPEEARDLTITIPYVGTDTQRYFLTVTFSLQRTISNSAPSETNDEIKIRAPQSYYTQSRMVNNKDYNVFPLQKGNEILKLRTINRTHSGHSRYLPINDPTGFHQSILIDSDDGCLFKDYVEQVSSVYFDVAVDSAKNLVNTSLADALDTIELRNFFYGEYLNDFRVKMREAWVDGSPYSKSNVFYVVPEYKWVTQYGLDKNKIGRIANLSNSGNDVVLTKFSNRKTNFGSDRFLEIGSVLKVASNKQSEQYVTATITGFSDGEWTVNTPLDDGWVILEIMPPFRNKLSGQEVSSIANEVALGNNFGIAYILDSDVQGTGTGTGWVITTHNNSQFSITNGNIRDQWLVKCGYKFDNSNSTNSKYDIVSRGTRYLFESQSDVKFYFDYDNQKNFASDNVIAGKDQIVISSKNGAAQNREEWILKSSTGGNRWVSSSDSSTYYPDEMIPLRSRSADSSNTSVTIKNINEQSRDISDRIANGIVYVNSSFGGISPTSSLPTLHVGNTTVTVSYDSKAGNLGKDYTLSIVKPYYEANGSINPSIVEVVPSDTSGDGVAEDIHVFDDIVGKDDIVFHEDRLDSNGDVSMRLWSTGWKDIREETTVTYNAAGSGNSVSVYPPNVLSYPDIVSNGLLLVEDGDYLTAMLSMEYSLMYWLLNGNTDVSELENNFSLVLFKEARDVDTDEILTEVTDNFTPLIEIFVNEDALSAAKTIAFNETGLTETEIRTLIVNYLNLAASDRVFKERTVQGYSVHRGRSYTTDLTETNKDVLSYKWRHFSPADHRIDPSVSNIMDMMILTNQYHADVTKWKVDGKPLTEMPTPPTTAELKANFSDLEDDKMMSDDIVFNPISFKVIFGAQAKPELRAKLKVIRTPNTTLTDNEIKSRVIEYVDSYFSVDNWDTGETFYFTELASFIHSKMYGIIGSVVLVPAYVDSQFGNLFELKCEPHEIFISTAKVTDVEIIDTLTYNNMRLQ